MKRKVVLLAGAAALGVAVYCGGRLLAQGVQQTGGTVAPAAAPLRTRIALVNLPQVIKGYTKYMNFEREWQAKYQEFEKAYDNKRTALVSYQKNAENEKDPTTREKWEAYIRHEQRQMQDMGEDAKKKLGKMRDDQAVQIYKEIEEAVQAYARSQEIDLVMHFNENIVPAERDSPMNIQRKLQIGACFPVYAAPGMDITGSVVTMLNNRYAQMTSQPVPGTTAQPKN